MEFKRLIAYVVDIFMSVILFMPICACIILLKKELEIETVDKSIIPFLIWGIMFCKDCLGGRSIGKRIMGYQIIDSNTGQIARPYKCVLRNLFYLLGLIDIAAMFYHSKGLRLGDYVAHTKVVTYQKGVKQNRWGEAILVVVCVFAVLLTINMLLTYYASSLGLFGLLYQ